MNPARLAALVLVAVAVPARAAQRVALVVGANTGWSEDQPLRHATEDAQRLADTLVELGDFPASAVQVLSDPTTKQLRAIFDQLAAEKPGADSLFVFYYSGHSDHEQLHLRGDPLTLDELYHRVRDLPFAVKVGILDSCQSGSITIAKGGRPAPLFKVAVQDDLKVRGTAFLTSSGADELSQEARALSGSFFSHHLVSGLRGAADEDGDGRVSLAEAYRYAAARTTLDTAETAAGAQRPAFRYELNGHGEVYLTRLLRPQALLSFPPGRRCFVTDPPERHVEAEVFPVDGTAATQLALPAAEHVIKCPEKDGYQVASVNLVKGEKLDVAQLDFRRIPLSDGVLKGAARSDGESPAERRTREGFDALRAGKPEQALADFNWVLAENARDPEAYRGRAQAYLAMASRARYYGNVTEEQRLIALAVQADPQLRDYPNLAWSPGQWASATTAGGITVPASATGPAAADPDATPYPAKGADGASGAGGHGPATAPPVNALAEEQKRMDEWMSDHPRAYQTWGLGLSFLDAHGLFTLSLERVLFDKFQAAAHVNIAAPGFGLSGRWVPLEGWWSPFLGVGGQMSLKALGADSLATSTDYHLGDWVFAQSNTFDRVFYIDGGIELVGRHWQADAGVAYLYSAPAGGTALAPDPPPGFGALAVLSVKYFCTTTSCWPGE